MKVIASPLTSKQLADALIRAKKRDLDVEVISNTNVELLKNSDIPVYIDSKQHNNLVILDGELVLTGSFSFIANNRNIENSVPICIPVWVKQYEEIWEYYKSQSNEKQKD